MSAPGRSTELKGSQLLSVSHVNNIPNPMMTRTDMACSKGPNLKAGFLASCLDMVSMRKSIHAAESTLCVLISKDASNVYS